MSAQNTKILLIDDDAEIRYSLDRVLSQDGHEVLAADSGEDGIQKAKELTPKFRQGKIGTVEVGGQQMSSQQAYEMVQKGLIDSSQLGKQTIGQAQGFFTKAGKLPSVISSSLWIPTDKGFRINSSCSP